MNKPLLAVLIALLAAGPVHAQNDVCMDNRGNVDQAATDGWRAFQANADGGLMSQLTGVWYVQIPSPQTGQVAHRYQTMEPNGLFTMQTRVCDSAGFCSDYPGHGFCAAQAGQGGSIVVMGIVSDIQVTNYCNLTYFRTVGNGMMQDQMGLAWQRVQ